MTISLNVKKRSETKKKTSQLRKRGVIPAVVYGHKVNNWNISVLESEFKKVYKAAGESTLIDLLVENAAPVRVIIQDVQLHPVMGDYMHVDFHQVNMKEKLHTNISLKFVGEAPAVKSSGGVLITNKNSIEVKCLPADLIHEIEVDLSHLKNLEDSIRVKDLNVPKTIEVLDLSDEVVAIVTESKTEKEAEAVSVPVDTKVEPEVIGKKEKESADAEGDSKPEDVKAEKKQEKAK